MCVKGMAFLGRWGMRLLVGLGLFAGAASERMLLLAGVVLPVAGT